MNQLRGSSYHKHTRDMGIDLADLDPDTLHGRPWRKLRAQLQQRAVARCVMHLKLLGWGTRAAVEMAQQQFLVSKSGVMAALKRHRSAVERSATYQVMKEWSRQFGIRPVWSRKHLRRNERRRIIFNRKKEEEAPK
jgi:hypothetical protein